MNTPTKKTLSINSLKADYNVNIRDAQNYDIGTMIEQIRTAGRIIKPLVIRGEDNLILQGNRRYRAAISILESADCTEELRTALSKLDVIVYNGLSEQEMLSLIIDHGSEKPISKSEIVEAVWRLDRQWFTETQICNLLLYALARYTGNERKIAELPKAGKEREKAIQKWFHGTVGNQMLAAAKMGEYVKRQFLLTRKAEDRLLAPERKETRGGVEVTIPAEVVEMRCSTTRITELSAAKSADQKAGGWTPEHGGEAFNALIEKFKGQDAGTVADDKVTRPSPSELREKSTLFSAPAIRNALLVAAGDQEAGRSLVEIDDRLKRQTMVMDSLRMAIPLVTDENVRKLLAAIVSETEVAGEVDVCLKPFVTQQS